MYKSYMNRKQLYTLLFMILTAHYVTFFATEIPKDFLFADRAAWSAACAQVPMNIDIKAKLTSAFAQHNKIKDDKAVAWSEFDTALSAVLDMLATCKLAQKSSWTSSGMPTHKFYDISRTVFEPYVQKLDLKKDDKVIFHGDLHGDIHSLLASLQDLETKGYLLAGSFKLAHKHDHIVFLGDYVDRGLYGSEVLYTLLRLKLANPDQVIMVRGNHEDESISNKYGFKHELQATFGESEDKFTKIYRLYNFLPVALYVGHHHNYIQCCHGGLEYGYKPQNLLQSSARFDLLGKIVRKDFEVYLQSIQSCHCVDHWTKISEAFNSIHFKAPVDEHGTLGFMWFDFSKFGNATWKVGRGLVANKDLTKTVLEYQSLHSPCKVKGVIRAHQHAGSCCQDDPTNIMDELIKSNGVYKFWQPIETDEYRSLHDTMVFTLNIAPDSMYGKGCHFGFDTYAILSVASKYEDWRLQVCNVQIIDRDTFARYYDSCSCDKKD